MILQNLSQQKDFFYQKPTKDKLINILQSYPLLMKHYSKNSSEIQSKFIERLMKQVSSSDCPGFIYGFKQYVQHTQNPYSKQYWIKIGRTKNPIPKSRIQQWQVQDNTKYIQVFAFSSQSNCKLQALVHLIFAYARKVRQINGNKRIQWFFFQQKVLHASVTQMIDELMEIVHRLSYNFEVNYIKQHQQNDQSDDNKDEYETFIKQLIRSPLLTKILSLKQLQLNILQQLQLKQSYNTISFGYSPETFIFNLSCIELHTRYTIIFAKNIVIPQKSEITFRIHYSKRCPIQIRMIIVSNKYEGLCLLNIQDHRYGKVLIIKADDHKDKSYDVLDGYFSQKKNSKKLSQLRIERIVKAYYNYFKD